MGLTEQQKRVKFGKQYKPNFTIRQGKVKIPRTRKAIQNKRKLNGNRKERKVNASGLPSYKSIPNSSNTQILTVKNTEIFSIWRTETTARTQLWAIALRPSMTFGLAEYHTNYRNFRFTSFKYRYVGHAATTNTLTIKIGYHERQLRMTNNTASLATLRQSHYVNAAVTTPWRELVDHRHKETWFVCQSNNVARTEQNSQGALYMATDVDSAIKEVGYIEADYTCQFENRKVAGMATASLPENGENSPMIDINDITGVLDRLSILEEEVDIDIV